MPGLHAPPQLLQQENISFKDLILLVINFIKNISNFTRNLTLLSDAEITGENHTKQPGTGGIFTRVYD
jgi:hypothetical protein